MADRWLIKAGGAYTAPGDNIWDAAGWPNDPVGDGGGFAEGADVARMDNNVVGNFTLGVNMACTGFNATNYAQTIAMGGWDLDVNGTLTLATAGGDVTGTGDIYAAGGIVLAVDLATGWTGTLTSDAGAGVLALACAGVTIPNLTINNAPTSLSLSDNLTVGDLTYTAGKFTTTGRTVSLIADGVARDVTWNASGYPLAHFKIPNNAKCTLGGTYSYVSEITFGTGVGGVSLTGAGGTILRCHFSGNDKWHQTATSGTVSPDIIRIYATAAIQIGYLDASAVGTALLVYASGASRTITMTDNWTAGAKAMSLGADAGGNTATLDTAGYDLTTGAFTLGLAAAANASGSLDLATGRHSLASITPGHNDNQNNALDLATCFLTLGGATDLTNTNPVTVTSTASIVYGAVTVTGWGCTGWAWVPQGTNGTGNGQMLWGTPAAQLVGGGLAR